MDYALWAWALLATAVVMAAVGCIIHAIQDTE